MHDRPDCPAAAYIVALRDSADAVALVRNRVGNGAKIEDKGRVSDTLMNFLGLQPGDAKVLERPAKGCSEHRPRTANDRTVSKVPH
jgi:hypothetical protein